MHHSEHALHYLIMIERDKKGRYVSLRPARARRDEIPGNGVSASGLLLFLERKNIGWLVTGGRRQLGDARREIKGDALFADPEDETLGFLIGGDQPAVVFLEGYNFRCFCHMQNIGRWRRQFATES